MSVALVYCHTLYSHWHRNNSCAQRSKPPERSTAEFIRGVLCVRTCFSVHKSLSLDFFIAYTEHTRLTCCYHHYSIRCCSAFVVSLSFETRECVSAVLCFAVLFEPPLDCHTYYSLTLQSPMVGLLYAKLILFDPLLCQLKHTAYNIVKTCIF